jgi:hypothetical protein
MQRFLGIFASDHRHLACAIARVWPGFLPADPAFRGRLGLGTHGGDEVLRLRRPVAPGIRGDELVGPASGNVALFTVDDRDPGRFTPEGTAPWRYRALLGTVTLAGTPDGELEARAAALVPPFLAREAPEEPAESVAFRLVLSVLNDMGRLDPRQVPADVLGEAVRAALRLWPRVGTAADGSLPGVALCVTDGRCLAAGATAGAVVQAEALDGIEDCQRCSEPGRSRDHDPVRARHPGVRTVVLSGGTDAWRPGVPALEDGAVAVLDEDGFLRVRGGARL